MKTTTTTATVTAPGTLVPSMTPWQPAREPAQAVAGPEDRDAWVRAAQGTGKAPARKSRAAAIRSLMEDGGYSRREAAAMSGGEIVTTDGCALLIVALRGGDAGDADAAVCVDLDPGDVRPGEWKALVRADRLDELVNNTGAEKIGVSRAWYGETFGDGNGGTVAFEAGRMVGSGLNVTALG